MPNQKGGKKFKRGGKKNNHIETKLIYKDVKEDQEYAKITKVNGSGRYKLICFDGNERLGITAGSIKKKFRFTLGDIVLVSLWNFQDDKCSIIHRYEIDEALKLKNEGEFPDSIILEEENEFRYDDYNPFIFDNNLDKDDLDNDDKDDLDNEEKKSSSSSDEEVIDLEDI